jgi:hypothetical protein
MDCDIIHLLFSSKAKEDGRERLNTVEAHKRPGVGR